MLTSPRDTASPLRHQVAVVSVRMETKAVTDPKPAMSGGRMCRQKRWSAMIPSSSRMGAR